MRKRVNELLYDTGNFLHLKKDSIVLNYFRTVSTSSGPDSQGMEIGSIFQG